MEFFLFCDTFYSTRPPKQPLPLDFLETGSLVYPAYNNIIFTSELMMNNQLFANIF